LQSRTSQGADADAARVRALAAYKDFLTSGKTLTPTSPPERNQGGVQEAGAGQDKNTRESLTALALERVTSLSIQHPPKPGQFRQRLRMRSISLAEAACVTTATSMNAALRAVA